MEEKLESDKAVHGDAHTEVSMCHRHTPQTPQEIMKISWKVLQNVLQLSTEFDETIT
jgi:hypothetical protein